MTVRAVVFDVGETLVDETRVWSAWADHLGVPRLTFLAALGAVIARGGDHREVFELFLPGIDLRAELQGPAGAALVDVLGPGDLYPDAVPCLRVLSDLGYRLGVAGNQPSSAETTFRDLNLSIELVGSSEAWGVAKPDPAFFERVASELALPPRRICRRPPRQRHRPGGQGRDGVGLHSPWSVGMDPVRPNSTIDRDNDRRVTG